MDTKRPMRKRTDYRRSGRDRYRYICMYAKIEEIPASFDKEKVIEELKGQIELVSYNPMTTGRYIKKNRAIEIVEKGGIE